ncbi:hypothetical protein Leryth_013289 [Lithospermum erythrorhizon]|nr:hypothetical protein Leryth_013289 [Lithospermum erythrorhizon]
MAETPCLQRERGSEEMYIRIQPDQVPIPLYPTTLKILHHSSSKFPLWFEKTSQEHRPENELNRMAFL